MSTQVTKTRAIAATEVHERQRLGFLPDLFGNRLMMIGESMVYDWAARLSPTHYKGGLWRFYRLSNGGGYLSPPDRGSMLAEFGPNGYEGMLSADAFGIVATLFALNQLCFKVAERGGDCDPLAQRYHALLDFARDHHERNAIFRIID